MKLRCILILASIFYSQDFDVEPFKLVHYRDFVNLAKEINDLSLIKKRIFQVYDVFEKYPQIRRPGCAVDFKGECKNYIFEISIFEKGNKYVSNKPTVLLMAGIHGDEVTGSNSLYRLI